MIIPTLLLFTLAAAQTCKPGFTAGADTVLYTTPYTYSQVISIIGSWQNLTWSGNPPSTVTLSGPDNTVGTSRAYTVQGLAINETLLHYSKPSAGPYVEYHALGLVSAPGLSFYADYDGAIVTSACGGLAAAWNETVNFCATNVTAAAALLHQVHLADAQTVAKFLGGMNFTTCEAISVGAGGSNGTNATGTYTSTGMMPIATAGGNRDRASGVVVGLAAIAASLTLLVTV